MKIKHNEALPLRTPRFCVDKTINPEIEKYDVLNTINRPSATAFIGTSGSGKTSLMYSFLMNTKPKIWKKQYEYIICVMPRASRNSLKNNIFDKYLEPDALYDTLDEQCVDGISAMIEANAEEGAHTLLILDDVATALKSPYITQRLQHLCYAYRHFRLSMVILVQTIKTIPLSIRKNLSNIIVFYKPRISEWETITHEYLEMKKEESKELYDTVFVKKFDWCLMDLTTGRIFKEFDEILWKNENVAEK